MRERLITDNHKLANLRLLMIEEILIAMGRENMIPNINEQADILLKRNENNEKEEKEEVSPET